MHGYFLLSGDVHKSIGYDVDRIRDGGGFTTRRVKAIQSGRAIFHLSASFQAPEEGFDHADAKPEVPAPDGLPSQAELARRNAARIPEPLRSRVTTDGPIEIRAVDPMDPMNPDVRPPESAAWFRAAGALPDQPALHRTLLAYASDFAFLAVAMYPTECRG